MSKNIKGLPTLQDKVLREYKIGLDSYLISKKLELPEEVVMFYIERAIKRKLLPDELKERYANEKYGIVKEINKNVMGINLKNKDSSRYHEEDNER